MKKKLFFWALVGLLNAQQYHQFTDYTNAGLIYFPSLSVGEDFFKSVSIIRHQWVIFPEAPRTYLTSLWGTYYKQSLYGGGYIYVDFYGPTRRSSFMISVNYKLNLGDSVFIGGGIGGGIQSFTIDAQKVFLEKPDPLISSKVYNDRVFDGIISGCLISPWGQAAFSVYHVFNNKLDLLYQASNEKNQLVRHFSFLLNPKLNITSVNLRLYPFLVIKYVSPVPLQLDISLQGMYKDMFWLGAFFRTMDSYGVFGGIKVGKQVYLGYAMDIPYTNMKKAGSFSSEVSIIVSFKEIKENTQEGSSTQLITK